MHSTACGAARSRKGLRLSDVGSWGEARLRPSRERPILLPFPAGATHSPDGWGQDCAGSPMEEVAKAECVSPGGGGLLSRDLPRGGCSPHTGATPSGTPPPTPPGTHLAMPTPLGTTSIMGLLTKHRARVEPNGPTSLAPQGPVRPRRPAGRCSLVSAGEAAVRRGCGGLQVSGRPERLGAGPGGARAASAHLPVRGRSVQAALGALQTLLLLPLGVWRCRRSITWRSQNPHRAAALRARARRRPAPPALHAGPAAPVACARTTPA